MKPKPSRYIGMCIRSFPDDIAMYADGDVVCVNFDETVENFAYDIFERLDREQLKNATGYHFDNYEEVEQFFRHQGIGMEEACNEWARENYYVNEYGEIERKW